MDLSEYILIDWSMVVTNLVLMGMSFAMALPVALNRERSSRSAGLRTYSLVAISACALMLIGIRVLEGTDAEARVTQGNITGMGFIGGGS